MYNLTNMFKLAPPVEQLCDGGGEGLMQGGEGNRD